MKHEGRCVDSMLLATHSEFSKLNDKQTHHEAVVAIS